MKKLFAILAIAGALTACNNSGDSGAASDTATTTDTATVTPLDTTTTAPLDTAGATVDTSARGAGAGADTTTR